VAVSSSSRDRTKALQNRKHGRAIKGSSVNRPHIGRMIDENIFLQQVKIFADASIATTFPFIPTRFDANNE
jgi:hypothetical protein